jgi:peptidoglycan/LPS O-acetylase OafA/YrhL
LTARFYRPELDVVRFIAFLTVFLHHGLADQLPPTRLNLAIQQSLGFGLCLFFTLSAYLITTLLLKERAATGTIDLPRFYKRRALRIWPLYLAALALVALAEVRNGKVHTYAHWYLAALFMLGNTIALAPPPVGHLWSISVEEQFYVFWPTLMRRVPVQRLLVAALALAVVSNAVLAWFGIIHADTYQRVWWNTFSQMEMFAAGILLAIYTAKYGYAKHPKALVLLGLPCIAFTWFAAVYSLQIKGPGLSAQGPLSLCGGYALIALSCAAFIFLLQGTENWPRPMIYFGKVSYGLYVFHIAGLAVAFHAARSFPLAAQLTVALAVTMLLAWMSYTWFESPFLRLKERYEVVPSRPVSS